MKKLILWMMRIGFGLLLFVVLVFSVVIIFKIPINLTPFKDPMELLLSKAMNRKVRIEKSVTISTSLTPYFTIEGLVIENPEGFNTSNFLAMELAKIQLELLPLLKKKIYISEFRVKGLEVTLEESKAGKVNWIFAENDNLKATTSEDFDKRKTPVDAEKPNQLTSDSLVIRRLELQDIEVTLHSPNLEKTAHIQLQNCLGTMLPGQPLNIDTHGNAMGFEYTIDISIGSLEELLLKNLSWVEIQMNIADTSLHFNGNINTATATKSMVLKATLQGENLRSLNSLLHLDLPPLASYKLETDLHLRPNEYELQKLIVKTGSSNLEGTAKVLTPDNKAVVDIQLRSKMIQLDDFIFDDWSWVAEKDVAEIELTENTEKLEKEKSPDTTEPQTTKKLLDGESLAGLECLLDIEANKVLSGADDLGSGRLLGSISEGRVKIDPLMLHLPGGKIEMMASFKPGAEKSDANLIVDIDNFDIGVLVNRSKPESEMGGLVNLDANLHSSAATVQEMLKNGNGYFDFSGKLQNFSAGVIDLWAVNLVAAIVSSAEKEKSMLNCAVGRWSVTDGILQSDAFFIDTDKIRICAEGKVNFKDERIDINVKPKAKKAQFFSLATPLEVHGSFTDINVGLGGGGLVGTAIKFIASPVSAPIQRTFANKIPADGSDVCNMELGPRGKKKIIIPMCND